MAQAAPGESPARPLRRVAALVLVALGSLCAGFGLTVHLSERGRGDDGAGLPTDGRSSRATKRAAPGGSQARPDAGTPGSLQGGGDVDALSPPSRGPTIGADLRYARCWESREAEPRPSEQCGRLVGLERLVEEQLPSVGRCAENVGTSVDSGTISLAMDLDFEAQTVRVWAGDGSDIPEAGEIVACAREALTSVRLKRLRNRWVRYTVFVPIQIGEPGERPTPHSAQLVLDRVRVRREPETGEILERLGRGERVDLLEAREGWVKVRTAKGIVGWVFADALPPGATSSPATE